MGGAIPRTILATLAAFGATAVALPPAPPSERGLPLVRNASPGRARRPGPELRGDGGPSGSPLRREPEGAARVRRRPLAHHRPAERLRRLRRAPGVRRPGLRRRLGRARGPRHRLRGRDRVRVARRAHPQGASPARAGPGRSRRRGKRLLPDGVTPLPLGRRHDAGRPRRSGRQLRQQLRRGGRRGLGPGARGARRVTPVGLEQLPRRHPVRWGARRGRRTDGGRDPPRRGSRERDLPP